MISVLTKMLQYKYQILCGLVLGIITSFMGYGAGGGLILSLIVGSLLLVITSGRFRTIKTSLYCVSLCLGFYVAGFTKISDPLSLTALLIFLCKILAPICVAFVVNILSKTRMAKQGGAHQSTTRSESKPK